MSGRRQLMIANGGTTLPYKRRVAYLESTGAQWIDTGVYPRDFLEFKSLVGIAVSSPTATTYWGENYGYWLGTADGMWTIGGGANFGSVTGDRQEVYFRCNAAELTSDAYHSEASVDSGAIYNRYGSSGRLSSNGTYYLFALNNFKPAHRMSARLYAQSLYGDGSLVRDFIPVLNWNDRPCLYDKVSKQLFYNQGTGEFNYA